MNAPDALAKLLAAMEAMPPRYWIVLQVEEEEEGEDRPPPKINQHGLREFARGGLSATLMEAPPEDGWPTRGARYGNSSTAPCSKNEEHEPACRSSVGSAPGDERFWALLLGMIEARS